MLCERPTCISQAVFPGDGCTAAGSEDVHDPTLIHFGERYFLFHTWREFGMVRSSDDLISWKIEGTLYPEAPDWVKARYDHNSAWAPDVVVLGTKLRVYYCCSNFGTNNSVIGLAECDRFNPYAPLEGWCDKGLVLESKIGEPFNAIDPEVVVDKDDRHWMVFGSYWGGIYVVELDRSTGFLKEPANPNLICLAKNTAEPGNPIEGAAVCLHDGWYYLFVSYGLAAQGVRSTYRLMVGRSREVTGPYVDRDGKPMVEGGHTAVLASSPPMFAPGHCDVTQLPDGRWVLPMHFYDSRRHWHHDVWGRPTLQILEVLWDDDGWPLPGLPVEHQCDSRGGREGIWEIQVDFAEPKIGDVRTLFGGDQLSICCDSGEVVNLKTASNGCYAVGRSRAGQVIRGYQR